MDHHRWWWCYYPHSPKTCHARNSKIGCSEGCQVFFISIDDMNYQMIKRTFIKYVVIVRRPNNLDDEHLIKVSWLKKKTAFEQYYCSLFSFLNSKPNEFVVCMCAYIQLLITISKRTYKTGPWLQWKTIICLQ